MAPGGTLGLELSPAHRPLGRRSFPSASMPVTPGWAMPRAGKSCACGTGGRSSGQGAGSPNRKRAYACCCGRWRRRTWAATSHAASSASAVEGPAELWLEALSPWSGFSDCTYLPARGETFQGSSRCWIFSCFRRCMRGSASRFSKPWPLDYLRCKGGPGVRVVPGETGLLVEAGNAAALADAIGSLLRDPERARRSSRAGTRARCISDVYCRSACMSRCTKPVWVMTEVEGKSRRHNDVSPAAHIHLVVRTPL